MMNFTDDLNNNRIDGAIFDMDGTLIDSMPRWKYVARDFLVSCNKTPKADLAEKVHPLSVKAAAKYFQTDYDVKLSVEEIVDGIHRQMEDYYLHEFELKPKTVEFLELLRQHNIKMCIATATDRRLATAALERNGILHFFDEIFTCAELNTSKREPKIFEAALEFLGTEKQRTYVFEDSYFAIAAAKSVHFPVFAVYEKTAEEYSEQIKELADIYTSFDKIV